MFLVENSIDNKWNIVYNGSSVIVASHPERYNVSLIVIQSASEGSIEHLDIARYIKVSSV